MSKEPRRFPRGWDEERTRCVIAHYEEQSEDAAVAEDEMVLEDKSQAVFTIPSELVPTVRKLLAEHQR